LHYNLFDMVKNIKICSLIGVKNMKICSLIGIITFKAGSKSGKPEGIEAKKGIEGIEAKKGIEGIEAKKGIEGIEEKKGIKRINKISVMTGKPNNQGYKTQKGT
jgi:hypothetical protein